MKIAWLERPFARRTRTVPIVHGTLEAIQKTSLRLRWNALNGRTPLYRLRVDGEHYFVDPWELDCDDNGELNVKKLRRGESIVVAYRTIASGRRIVAWALQPGVAVAHSITPTQKWRNAVRFSATGAPFLVCAYVALDGIFSADAHSTGWLVAGVALGLVAVLLMCAALFELWDIRHKDRYSYDKAMRQAVQAQLELATETINEE